MRIQDNTNEGEGRSAAANTSAGSHVKLSEEKLPVDKADFSKKKKKQNKKTAATVG